MTEKRKANIIYHKAGNGKSAKLTMPIPWLRDMQITEEEKSVLLEYNEEDKKIIITKNSDITGI